MKESDDVFMTELMTVQSSTLALQDQVDAVRNAAIIKNTAMGSAYAKWLGNAAMGDQYKELLSNIRIQPEGEYDTDEPSTGGLEETVDNQGKNEGDTVGGALRMCQENQKFYSDFRDRSNDPNI